MSRAWGLCNGCGEWTLHHILTVKNRVRKGKDQLQVTGMWDGDTALKWLPGKYVQERVMLRQCNRCDHQWWEVLEHKELTDEERWPQ